MTISWTMQMRETCLLFCFLFCVFGCHAKTTVNNFTITLAVVHPSNNRDTETPGDIHVFYFGSEVSSVVVQFFYLIGVLRQTPECWTYLTAPTVIVGGNPSSPFGKPTTIRMLLEHLPSYNRGGSQHELELDVTANAG